MKYEDICAEVQNGLPLYVGGDLEAAASAEIERHLEVCAACKDDERAARDARKLLVSALALSERRGPDLWPNVRAVLTEDGLIRSQPPVLRTSALPARPAYAKYALAAAAALLAGLWLGRALFESAPVVGPEQGGSPDMVGVPHPGPTPPVVGDGLRHVGRHEPRLRDGADIYLDVPLFDATPAYDPGSAAPVRQLWPRTQ